MKKNLGSVLALYPMPIGVVGAMDGDKPTYTLVAHMGILGHDKILVSLASNHYINEFIIKSGKLSVNLVEEDLLKDASKAGFISGKNQDKSNLYNYDLSSNNTPLIKESPLILDLEVVDNYKTNGFDNFICTISATYVEDNKLDDNGKIDYNKLKPVLFEFPTYSYLKTGEVLGKCVSYKE